MKLDPALLKSSETATAAYQANLEQARSYLVGRGILHATAVSFRLGVVVDPAPEHEPLYVRGRLSIPYLTRSGVVNIKFRDMTGTSDVKYIGLDVKPRLYNVDALFADSPIIGITEGELDAMVLSAQCGIPAVGCPGVSTWQEHFPRLFDGYERVLVFADGDDAGAGFASRVSHDLDNGTVIKLPEGVDVNDLYLTAGADGLRKLAGL